jgi:acetoacetate decarboxylase
VEGKLILRDLPSCPVVDLPVLETVSIQWVRRSSDNTPVVLGPVDPELFAPFAAARYA